MKYEKEGTRWKRIGKEKKGRGRKEKQQELNGNVERIGKESYKHG